MFSALWQFSMLFFQDKFKFIIKTQQYGHEIRIISINLLFLLDLLELFFYTDNMILTAVILLIRK